MPECSAIHVLLEAVRPRGGGPTASTQTLPHGDQGGCLRRALSWALTLILHRPSERDLRAHQETAVQYRDCRYPYLRTCTHACSTKKARTRLQAKVAAALTRVVREEAGVLERLKVA